MAEKKVLAAGVTVGTEEHVMETLTAWENRLLLVDPQTGDHEFGRIRHHLEQIAHRIAKRMADKNRNKCAQCSRPLGPRGPVDTIAVPDPATATGWRNAFACSTVCADKLKMKAHADGLRTFGSNEPASV